MSYFFTSITTLLSAVKLFLLRRVMAHFPLASTVNPYTAASSAVANFPSIIFSLISAITAAAYPLLCFTLSVSASAAALFPSTSAVHTKTLGLLFFLLGAVVHLAFVRGGF